MDYFKTSRSYFFNYLQKNGLYSSISYFRRIKRLKKGYFKCYNDLNEKGYHIIKNYLPAEFCAQTTESLKEGFSKYKKFIRDSDDKRIFGVELFLNGARYLATDEKFSDLSDLVNSERSRCAFTLGAWLKTGANGSSGGGWHRDAFLSQFKAMLYLTDVTEENGPFELLPESHKLRNVLKGISKAKLKHWQSRLSDEDVGRVEQSTTLKRRTFTGKAGTLILFNSTAIHRGKPIVNGERISLTNYYFPYSRGINSLRKQFSPILTEKDLL